jgi:hypothetical protein
VRVSCGSEEAKSSSSGRRCEQRWEFLATGKLVINVAALLNSAPVGKLKFLFLIRLRGGFIRLVILSSEEQIERFLEFSRYVVLDLGVRAPPLARRTLRRFRLSSHARRCRSNRSQRPGQAMAINRRSETCQPLTHIAMLRFAGANAPRSLGVQESKFRA